MAILTPPDDYAEVRETLDVTLDSILLPDATIGRDAFVGEAEREVLARDPLAAGYPDGSDEAKRVRLACIYLTAARIAPSLPVLLSENVAPGISYARASWDPIETASRLRAQADRIFDAYLPPSTSTEPSATVPFGFGLASASRGY